MRKGLNSSARQIFIPPFVPVIVCLILLTLSSCSFKEPVAPSWDVNLPVPLINRSFTMQELIDKNDFLVLNQSGLVTIDLQKDLDRYEVRDKLKVEDIHQSFSARIGEVEIPSPGSKQASVTLYDIYPPSAALNGQTVPVPPFSFDNISASLQGYENFQSLLIQSGYLEITLTNRLPVPLSAGSKLEVRNQQTDELIFKIQFTQQIAPGETVSQQADLSGVRVPADLKIVLAGGSPGSGTGLVEVNAYTAGVDVTAYISKIIASEATAVIEEQQFSGADNFVLGDSIIVTQANIASGSIHITYENHVPLNLNVDLTLPDFQDQAGQPGHLYFPIKAGQAGNQTIDVSGYQFLPTRSDTGSVVRFAWDVQVASSGGNFVTITSNDDFSLQVDIPQIVFTQLRGILKDIQFDLESIEETIDLPDGIDSLTFDAARMELLVTNGIGFPIRPDITIIGRNENSGDQVELPITQPIQAANGHPVESVIMLNESNSPLLDFLKVSPDRLIMDGKVILGDGSMESEISRDDFIETSIHVSVPLSVSFPSQIVKTDLDTIEIDQDIQKELRENILTGKLYAVLENHLPLGFDVSLHFSSRDTSVYTNPELTIGPISLLPAPVSQTEGRVVQEYPSEIMIDLDRDEIAMFANNPLYFGLTVHIPGSNGKKLRIYGTDYLDVKAYCEFQYHVDPGKLSE